MNSTEKQGAPANPAVDLADSSTWNTGVAEALEPLVRRVLAPNPSPYTFTGTGISYLTELDSSEGDADVYIDGQFVKTVSANIPTASHTAQQTVFSTNDLPNGQHTLRVVMKSGQFMLIDRLDVSDPGEEKHRLEHFERARKLSRDAAVAAVSAYREELPDDESRHVAQAFLDRVKGETDEARPPWAGADGAAIITLSQRVLNARRAALIAARDAEELDDEIMREVLEQMDREQAVADNWKPDQYGQF